MRGWRLSAVAEFLGAKVLNTNYIEYLNDRCIEGYACDSRQAAPNGLFFALKGQRVDGHDFLLQASENKAVGAVVAEDYEGADFGLCLIKVPDVLGAMQQMAKASLAQRDIQVVAVTGSVGKTTIKEFIAALLEAKYRVAKTPGNANSQVGLPLSILNLKGEFEVLVVEMGMTMPGEINRLVQIAPPDIALINKIAYCHSENFPTGIEGIAWAKGEILTHPKTKCQIVHAKSALFEGVATRGPSDKITFSLEDAADYRLRLVDGMAVIEEAGQFSPPIPFPFAASHLCSNFLGAVAVARKIGIGWPEIAAQAKHLHLLEKRFETIEQDGIVFINDCYNASPESMKAALSNLPKPKSGGKTVAVLGEMLELGRFSDECHSEVGRSALEVVDHLLCFGKKCQPMADIFHDNGRSADVFTEMERLKTKLYNLAHPGDVVLLKGSNSLQLWRLLEKINQPNSLESTTAD